MTLRTWLTSTLKSDSTLQGFHGGRVYQAGSMTSAKTPKPFVVHHVGNDTDEGLSESDSAAHRRFFQIYVHDVPGDYGQVDAIGDRVIALLRSATVPSEGIILVRFLERSQDLTDEVMGTIFNYIRFQAVYS